MRRYSRVGKFVVGLLLLVATAVGAAPPADSVILFIGDGMGANHIAMTQRVLGRELAMQGMPARGTVRTVNVFGGVTDSAAAATALASGFKTDNGKLGITPDGRQVETILERCRRAGKSVGIVTTDQLTGATPAGFVANVASRDQAEEIGAQMLSSGAQVMLSYGDGKAYSPRLDELRRAGYGVALSREELRRATAPKLIGFFNEESDQPVPLVAEMTRAAIARLSKNPKGFFLVVEHARIDWEPGDPAAIVADVKQLDDAVAAAMEYAKQNGRTLVLVTGDHETGGLRIIKPRKLAFLRQVNLRGWEIASHLDETRSNVAAVMAEYAGVKDLRPEEIARIREAEGEDIDWMLGGIIGEIISARSGIVWTSDGNHTATPVRIFAFGPGAERFAGKLDNTDIPRRAAAVLGLADFPAVESGQAARLRFAAAW